MISASIHILTDEDFQAQTDQAFHRGVARGRFECASENRASRELLEQGASLFFGRRPDASHMNTDEFREAHLAWFTRVSDFLHAPSGEERG